MGARKWTMPFQGIRSLWVASFHSPKSEDGLEEFNLVANIAARGCLLVGGITSMGFIYLISFQIFKGLLPYAFANILSIIAILFWFIIVDIFLGVTFPLWTKMWVGGKFKKQKIEGNKLMRVAGTSLFLISFGIAFISIWTSIESAEIPVLTALSSTHEKDSTSNELRTALQGQLHLSELVKSYDEQLEQAKQIDKQELESRMLWGHNRIQETHNRYKHRSRSYYDSKMRKARKDSTNRVDDYERAYLRISRDKDNALGKIQASNTRLEIAGLKKQDRLQGMFDKKLNTSIWLLTVLGVMGTLLFIAIKFVQIVLNTGIKTTSNPQQNTIGSGTYNTPGYQKRKKNYKQNFHTEGNFEKFHPGDVEDFTEHHTNKVPQANDVIDVPALGKKMLKKDVRSAISKHANNWAAIKDGKRSGILDNEYQRWLAHLQALAMVDQQAAIAVANANHYSYGIELPDDF